MNATRLSIVIVNFNTAGYLDRCLASLPAGVEPFAWDAVVVDNASSDGSERAVFAAGPQVSLVRNARNVGFGRAVNQGVAATQGELVLLLNPDCELVPGSMAPVAAELLADDRCAAAGPDVVNPDGSSQGNARGEPSLLTGLFGRSALLTRTFPSLRIVRRNIVLPSHVPDGVRSIEVDWISGACLLVRRSAFERVGGFDERYFLYWEDADLGRRLRNAGARIRYVPGARVVHAIGQSSLRAQDLAIREFHRSAWLYYSTHAAPAPANPMRIVARLLLGVRCWYYLRRNRAAGPPAACPPPGAAL